MRKCGSAAGGVKLSLREIVAMGARQVMNVWKLEDLPPAPESSVVTIGVFDGVHRGHQRILRLLADLKSRDGHHSSWVVTFDRHPLEVLHPEAAPPLLTTPAERVEEIRRFDVDHLLMLDFDHRLSQIDHKAFLREFVMQGLGMKHLVVGYDFHFGKGRGGTPHTLAELSSLWNFELDVVDALREGRTIVSSTAARMLVAEGRMQEARSLLGRPYSFSGRVVRGDGRGKEIGRPTANLDLLDPRKLLPGRGVYAAVVQIAGEERRRGGMLNVGTAPTVGRGALVPEVHVLDFEGDLYGREMKVFLLQYVRAERRMDSMADLEVQLDEDECVIRAVFEQEGGIE